MHKGQGKGSGRRRPGTNGGLIKGGERTGVRVTSLNELSDTAYTQPIAEVRCGLGPELSGVYATEEGCQ